MNRINLSDILHEGALIRHKGSCLTTWTSTWDAVRNCIMYGKKQYNSLSGFASDHYKIERPERTSSANGWAECDVSYDNKMWVSLDLLRKEETKEEIDDTRPWDPIKQRYNGIHVNSCGAKNKSHLCCHSEREKAECKDWKTRAKEELGVTQTPPFTGPYFVLPDYEECVNLEQNWLRNQILAARKNKLLKKPDNFDKVRERVIRVFYN